MNDKDSELISEMCKIRQLSENSVDLYMIYLDKYLSFQNATLSELLNEADEDEDNRLRMKRRRIKNRLNSFHSYLLDNNYSINTVNTAMAIVIATYRYFEIETPSIHHDVHNTETIKDIPDKTDIRNAVESVKSIKIKAMILFMCSSGSSRNEVLNLTVKDFINATQEYHDSSSVKDILLKLKDQKDVIPTWHINRKKTHTQYFTFCTPEATRYIVKYLCSRLFSEGDISVDDKLFEYTKPGFTSVFVRVNNYLGGRRVGNRRFFHSHALRMFFATTLLNSDLDSMTIDFMSGRKISNTHEAYFKADPKRLKVKYQRVLAGLTILENIHVKELTTSEFEELNKRRVEQVELNNRVKKLEQICDKLPR